MTNFEKTAPFFYNGQIVIPNTRYITTGYSSDKTPQMKAPVRGRKNPVSDTPSMSNLTRYELDAKLEAIEARMDGRVASIQSEIQGFLSAQQERDKRLDEQLEASRRDSDQRFQTILRDIDRLGSIKANVWGSMVTTIIILVAVGALALTSFQAGAVKQPGPVESIEAAPATPAPPLPAAQQARPAE